MGMRRAPAARRGAAFLNFAATAAAAVAIALTGGGVRACWAVAPAARGGVLHLLLAEYGYSPASPRRTLVRRRAGEADESSAQAASADAQKELLETLVKDPEAREKMQEEVEKLKQDPDKMKQIMDVQSMMKKAADELRQDPQMEEFFKEIKENPTEALKKYQNDPEVVQKVMAAAGLKQYTPSELEEKMIVEIFAKFDADGDKYLNLDEFNELQSQTEGADATYTAEQLTSLILAVHPGATDTEKGLSFEDYRRLYADGSLREAYGTDVTKDHVKIFGPMAGVAAAA